MVYSTWYRDIRILQTMVSGIRLVLGLRTRLPDPDVYVVCWAPSRSKQVCGAYHLLVLGTRFSSHQGIKSSNFLIGTKWGTPKKTNKFSRWLSGESFLAWTPKFSDPKLRS